MLTLLPALAVGGCGGHSSHTPNSAELQLERRQLLLVIDGLRSAQTSVAREVQVSRAIWPAIFKGLPTSPAPMLRKLIEQAAARARALAQPRFMAVFSRLTGPAAGLAGLYEAFDRLAERGWSLTEAGAKSIATGSSSVARFARANASLYIAAVYDAHFDLSLVGKSALEGYRHLGGRRVFGPTLTHSDIDAIAHAYSAHAVRLTPHPTAQ